LEAVEILLTAVEGFSEETVQEGRAALDHALFCVLQDHTCNNNCRWRPGNDGFAIVWQLITAAADVHVGSEYEYDPYFGLQPSLDESDEVHFALDNRLRADWFSDGGRTPLFTIVSNGRVDAGSVKAFINAGVDVKKTDENSATLLHFAT
jgi:ankyrin repeat protein